MKNVLLIGLGRMGFHIAKKLWELGHQVMAVDQNEERVTAILPYATNAQIGNATNVDFLSSLGVSNYDVCFVTIGNSFQDSLMTTSLLKDLHGKKVISRAATEVHEKFLRTNGADDVIYPEQEVADWAAIRYTADHIFDYIELDGKTAIVEVELPEQWVNHSIKELDIRRKLGFNVLGLRKGDKMFAAIDSNTVFAKDDKVLIMGNEHALQKWFHL